MTGDLTVLDALNECLKYERTLEDCAEQYRQYFRRWHFDRFECLFKRLAHAARQLKKDTMKRINKLDSIPANDRFDVEVDPIENAKEDTDKFIAYFDKLLEEARTCYEDGRKAAKDKGDSVSHKLMGRHKEEVEKMLARFEAKARRLALIGPQLYLAHHMHPEN
jgi:bacterioferritin (cytochrome b1)